MLFILGLNNIYYYIHINNNNICIFELFSQK